MSEHDRVGGYHPFVCACGACASGAGRAGALALDPEDRTARGALRAEQTATGTTYTTAEANADGKTLGDAVLSGYRWAVTALTYSFPDSAADFTYNDHNGQFRQLNDAQKWASVAALAQVAALTPLAFSELTGAADRDADLRFAVGGKPGTAWAYYPSTAAQGGDAWYNPNDYNAPAIGTYAYSTFLHEIGHALGLKHGHETGFQGRLPAANDSHEYSLMTYRSAPGGSLAYTNAYGSGPQTYMIADIEALQFMYGANFATNSGDTTYSFSTATGEMSVNGTGQGAATANVVFRTVWDGGGTDSYDFSNYTTGLAIDLAPGGFTDLDTGGNFQRARLDATKWARGHVFNASLYRNDPRSLIENAIGGAGNDRIDGNAAHNHLAGGAGDDTLRGGAGDDTLDGGPGTDTVRYGGAFGTYTLDLDAGVLLVTGEGTDRLLDTVEQVMFGNLVYRAADLLALAAGGGGGLSLAGSAGRDTITGTAGPDTLSGMGERDTLHGEAGADRLDGGEGDDLVQGGAGADSLTGGSGNDQIRGGGEDDAIDGGAGNDRLWGEAGDDTLADDAGADILDGGAGNDRLSGGAGADRLQGGDGTDTLEGGEGNDRLDGGAGDDMLADAAGNDQLRGGTGDDSLSAGDGADLVHGGAGNDRIAGGAGNDRLQGDDGNDTISGGAGTDTLHGGRGADLFVVGTDAGLDILRDFDRTQDRIDVSALGLSGLADFTVTQTTAWTDLAQGGVTLRIHGLTAAGLTADLFLF